MSDNVAFKMSYKNPRNGVTYVSFGCRDNAVKAVRDILARTPLPYFDTLLSFLRQASVGDSVEMRDIRMECVPVSDDGIIAVDTVIEYYDTEERYENCTVQILRNSHTGEESIGWWENTDE